MCVHYIYIYIFIYLNIYHIWRVGKFEFTYTYIYAKCSGKISDA